MLHTAFAAGKQPFPQPIAALNTLNYPVTTHTPFTTAKNAAHPAGSRLFRPACTLSHRFSRHSKAHQRHHSPLVCCQQRNDTRTGAISPAADGAAAAPLQPSLPALPRISGSLWKRIWSSILLGGLGACIIAVGGIPYCLAACLVAYQASQEYFGFVTSKGISEGMKPPPPMLCAFTSLSCVGFIVWAFITQGAATAFLAVAGFVVLSLQLLIVKRPRFAQLTSSLFGLFYCGYLPSFWIKLRLISAPAINSSALHSWPVMLGGLSQVTVGLVATFMTVLCIVAADTGAFFFGKSFGRTQLIPISPKKTVEGAIGGLLCSIAVALGVWRLVAWPAYPTQALLFGSLVFVGSLFGDLIESVMKREAGLKDAGSLIPGHGGLLDRFDSYLFTGAIVCFYVRFVTPLWGL